MAQGFAQYSYIPSPFLTFKNKRVGGRTWTLASTWPVYKSYSSIPDLCDNRNCDLEHFNFSEPHFPQVGDSNNQ